MSVSWTWTGGFVLNPDDETGRHDEGHGVDGKGDVDSERPGHETPSRCAQGGHHRPGGRNDRVRRPDLFPSHDIRQDGAAGSEQCRAQGKLDCRQRIENPDVGRLTNGEEAEEARDVAGDQDLLSIVAIGQDAGEWADQEWCEQADDEETADGNARTREGGDEGGRGDKVEPVAEWTDRFATSELAEVGVTSDEPPMADRRGIAHAQDPSLRSSTGQARVSNPSMRHSTRSP